MFETLPTTWQGWLGWGAAAVVVAVVYFPKAWAERRGESRENDRLLAALAEARTYSKDLERRNNELLDQNNALRDQNSALVREFADNKAAMARMELKMTYLTDEITSLKAQLQRATP